MVERFGLENEGMIGRYRLFIVEKGQERMLMKKEKPLVILRRRLLTAGHTKLDKLTSQGGRELQHLCRFVLQMSLLHGLPEEHDGMFDHLQGLVKLEDFNLQTIPAELHKAAPQLLRLSLRNNPLTDLPKDFCMATTQLKELNLSRTALKRIPAAVSYCTSLETLDVSYNRVKSLDMTYGSLENLKQLKTLRLHANILSDLPSSIADLPLQELRLDMNRFRHLPSVVCQLALLETLVLSHNDLETLPADIGTLTQLRILLAMGNNLHYLPSEMKGMTSLVYLNVSRNRLGDIAVISALPSLQHLEASHNSISSVPAFPKALKNVNLEANHFTRFNPAAKMLMTRAILRKLDMSHTKLSALQFDFAVFPDLQDLNVDDSRIGELPSSILKLDRLIKLSACNASLKFLPDALGDLPSLSELLVHSNDLRALPHSIWCCSSLRVFNASSNKLSTFPDAPQAKDETLPPLVKSMKELYLANNDLEGSALVPLSLFKHLTVLNVSYNKIRDIPHQTLWCLIRLEALFLSGNGLQTIRQGDLPPTASLARLYLNNNRLVSLPHEIEKYSKLAVLDVGNNSLKYNIHNYRFDYQWIWNDALQMLNLSGNMFLKIDKLRSVEKGIDRPQVNAADFRLLKNLQSLGLTDVTLAVTYLPEESDHCRIRTSASSLNGMRYSVSDSLGKDLMGTFDMAVSRFRGHEDECIFGIFSRELPAQTSPFQESNALTYYLFTHFRSEFSKELLYIKRDPKLGDIRDAMRRTFLNLNKGFYDSIVNPTGFEIPIKSSSPFQSGDPATRYPELQTGACACVAYLVDKTLYIANVGNVEALVGAQDGKMRVSTTLHVPFEAREAGRIKRAEEWVAPKGILKGEPKVSRAFGFYSKFPVVNPGPDIMKIQLSPDDHFIVIGNAEFWTYLNKDAAAKIIWDIDQAGDEMSAAQALRDVALAHGASGNAQVMVIMLSDLFHPPSTKKNGGQVNKFGRRTGGSGMIHRMAGLEEAPSGPMALCFTDVRNSTALYERLPGEGTGSMHSSLKLHNTCLRRLIRLCDGYEIKTEGDAFIVAFKSVLAAVHWCLKGQEELLTLDWPAALLNDPDGKVVTDADGVVIERGLMVRMGIHYGVPTASDLDPTTGRMDYFGSAVNRAARVGSSPKAGEIMLSAEVMKMLQPYRIEEPSTAANSSATDSRNALPSEESLNTPEVDEDQRHLEAIRELNPVLIPAGERMLKGIEQPEFLTRLFPRRLLGRAKTESADTQGAPVAPAKSEADPDALGMISRESVESLALVCRRLEALDAGRIFRLVEGADEHPTPDAQSQPLPGTATPGDSSKRSSETESHIVHGRLGQFLPTVDYSDESQVMQVMEGLIKRLEDSIKRLKAREALSDPVIRQLMHEKLGFDPEELLLLIGDATARLRGTHTQYLVGPQSPVPFA
ncbi:L domain-like protein [Calocera cornea HHB12733]|uniref:Adenylate cyclase n=1 Tax=Calocera cornea HHB12733 TaxID=1353952 RepID=A0A165C762_9BASI|nr:L domain-like protein [Calocera cornea HHB12733]